jgi:hypothetical protein
VVRRPLSCFFSGEPKVFFIEGQFQKRIKTDIRKPLIGRLIGMTVEKKTGAGILINGLKNLPGGLGREKGDRFLNLSPF